MKAKTIIVLGIIIILASACQKRKYASENIQLEKEDIYFTGYLGNEPLSLKIGTDGYYCYSSYRQQADSIYVFEGELKKFECSPCNRALRVELSDYRARVPGFSVAIDSVLRTGNRNFIPGLPKATMIKFVAHSNKEISSLVWNTSNGDLSRDSIMQCEFAQPGPQTVSLTVKTKSNCESRVINKIFIGADASFFACNISAHSLQNNSSQFKGEVVGGKPPYTYIWNFGDGSTSSDSAPLHAYKWAGSYPVGFRITDSENHVCESNYIFVSGNDNSSCAANISLSFEGSRNAFLNGVRIQWTDDANVTLRSDSVAQPAGSYFEILNSQEYAPNERGESGRLLTLRFNVLLSDGTRKLWFKSESAAIAVTYK